MKTSENFDLKSIGVRMRLVRMRLGMTQGMMANAIGISLSHYSKLEIGIGGMSRSLAYNYCNLFNIDKDWFLDGTGEEPPVKMTAPQREQPVMMPIVQQKAIISYEELEKVLELAQSKQIKKLAKVVSKQTGIPMSRAMAVLLHEQLVRPTDVSNDNK